MTPLIPATPDFTNVPVTPMDALLTMDEVLGEILAFTTTSTTTMGAAWSPSDSVWVASRDLQAFTTSTTSTTPGANDQEEHEEEIPDYLEVEVEETKDMELQDGEAVPGGELDDGYGVGSMALELTEREELLARHIATLVVAEMYHLLRSTGVVAGPAVPGGHVDVRVTMFVLLRHGDLQAVPSGVSGAAPVDTGASAMVEVTSEETNAGFELPGEALAVIVRGDSVRFLDSNKIQELPDSFGQLSALEELHLSDNALANFPDSFFELSQLQELRVACNDLKTVPDKFGQLSNLKELDLSANPLEELPDSLGQLEQLEELHLHMTKLTVLPESIQQLRYT
ncbi:IRL2, partial [Symbiodinium sp. KB8]